MPLTITGSPRSVRRSTKGIAETIAERAPRPPDAASTMAGGTIYLEWRNETATDASDAQPGAPVRSILAATIHGGDHSCHVYYDANEDAPSTQVEAHHGMSIEHAVAFLRSHLAPAQQPQQTPS